MSVFQIKNVKLLYYICTYLSQLSGNDQKYHHNIILITIKPVEVMTLLNINLGRFKKIYINNYTSYEKGVIKVKNNNNKYIDF